MQDTKENILLVSLDLFSRKGFTAVSVRDICKKVHIRESSVYYHFQNKQAILAELLNRFENTAKHMMDRLETGLSDTGTLFHTDFYDTIAKHFYEQYLADNFCNKVIRLLMIEQFGNEEAQKIYDYWVFEKALAFQSRVFSVLMKNGMIKCTDSRYLAEKYYAPIFLFAQRWLFCGTLTEERKQSFLTETNRHTQRFFEEIMEGN